MFNTVLVANRGEIALRIITVLKSHKIKTIAVYSEADANSPHTSAADHAVCLGPPPVRESYLDGAKIIEIAKAHGVDAIHPGYGLLSENSEFAKACTRAGIVFIGPSPEVIDIMGDKASARTAAERAGVPVVPGSNGVIQTIEEAEALADELGYPVLIKAAGGGGGIGMALVKKSSKLSRAFQSCQDRGAASFGNADVYMEKYIEAPRHIEVQILGDQDGNVIHLFERECTLQRRHQKVIEEAPSAFVNLNSGMREKLCEAAVSLAREVHYFNAGTVEFIADQAGNFYFIEMNTRLQVEHPVTEMVTGIDLITWQLKIASGESLTITQSDVQLSGHAVECRLYAEDPHNRFLPKPGEIKQFKWSTLADTRVDPGFAAPSTVTPYYDPMVAKLSAFGSDRNDAINKMTALLQSVEINPLVTNLSFLVTIMNAGDYIENQVDTTWLERFAKTLDDA